jgi:hypothetical protein
MSYRDVLDSAAEGPTQDLPTDHSVWNLHRDLRQKSEIFDWGNSED